MKDVTIESQLCYILGVMPSVETIYQQTIRPLPVTDQRRLVDMILENVDAQPTTERRSVLDILKSRPIKRVFKNSKEVDTWLRSERDAWDD